KACVLPENPASYRVVRTKSYLFNKAPEKASSSPRKMPFLCCIFSSSLLITTLMENRSGNTLAYFIRTIY
ncbi:hypothetical protein, partial [Klebsiella pneumoniae]|uniref:hypothetical protein n=1 Tax=Klebsiella pneumoniae TaxID=573 RepID=UPI003B5BC2CA